MAEEIRRADGVQVRKASDNEESHSWKIFLRGESFCKWHISCEHNLDHIMQLATVLMRAVLDGSPQLACHRRGKEKNSVWKY